MKLPTKPETLCTCLDSSRICSRIAELQSDAAAITHHCLTRTAARSQQSTPSPYKSTNPSLATVSTSGLVSAASPDPRPCSLRVELVKCTSAIKIETNTHLSTHRYHGQRNPSDLAASTHYRVTARQSRQRGTGVITKQYRPHWLDSSTKQHSSEKSNKGIMAFGKARLSNTHFEHRKTKTKHVDEGEFSSRLFDLHRICEMYFEVVSLSRVKVFQFDEDAPKQRVLIPGSNASHWKADLELITERILKDQPDLQKAWFDLCESKPVSPELETPLGKHHRRQLSKRCVAFILQNQHPQGFRLCR